MSIDNLVQSPVSLAIETKQIDEPCGTLEDLLKLVIAHEKGAYSRSLCLPTS